MGVERPRPFPARAAVAAQVGGENVESSEALFREAPETTAVRLYPVQADDPWRAPLAPFMEMKLQSSSLSGGS
jgi:hypothetical protein